jgi:hypothetical protein
VPSGHATLVFEFEKKLPSSDCVQVAIPSSLLLNILAQNVPPRRTGR